MIMAAVALIALGDLTKGEVKNLAGHERGVSARAHFRVEELDSSPEQILVEIPADFRAVSPSFFQGMFAESVHALGGAFQFFDHYRFDAPAHIRSRLIEYARQAEGR